MASKLGRPAKYTEEPKRLNLLLDQNSYEKLKALSEETRRSMSDIVQSLVHSQCRRKTKLS